MAQYDYNQKFNRDEVREYYRQGMIARGIDPSIGLRVFQQESGFNPNSRNLTSPIPGKRRGEQSYGVAQLNADRGLGTTALQKGINIYDPSTWKQQADFALDTVKQDGYRQWFGARDVGIGRWDGISRDGQPPAAIGVGGSARASSPAGGAMAAASGPTGVLGAPAFPVANGAQTMSANGMSDGAAPVDPNKFGSLAGGGNSMFGGDKGILAMLGSDQPLTMKSASGFLSGAPMQGAMSGLSMMAQGMAPEQQQAPPPLPPPEENNPDLSLLALIDPKKRRAAKNGIL